jgi:hypothetical protein
MPNNLRHREVLPIVSQQDEAVMDSDSRNRGIRQRKCLSARAPIIADSASPFRNFASHVAIQKSLEPVGRDCFFAGLHSRINLNNIDGAAVQCIARFEKLSDKLPSPVPVIDEVDNEAGIGAKF